VDVSRTNNLTTQEDDVSTDAAVEQWGSDGLFFTEAARGGPLAWRVGQTHLEGDALGPVRHAHDNAAEYYYMFSGSADVDTGEDRFVLQEGELGLIPPDAPHNFYGPTTEKDACLFCIVGPNYADNKWRIDNFLPGTESLRMAVARPFVDAELPGGGTLSAEAIELGPADAPRIVTPKAAELVYVVADGELDVALAGGLHGTLKRGTYLHVRDGVRHELSTSSACKVLLMSCGFAVWEGVPLGDASPSSAATSND
jgi:mannose-6-phosphate isomerase-like protein (cupin superfamily)